MLWCRKRWSSAAVWLDGSYTTDTGVASVHSDAVSRWLGEVALRSLGMGSARSLPAAFAVLPLGAEEAVARATTMLCDAFGRVAGKGVANPLATILSVAMMLRYSLDEAEYADRIEAAVTRVLDQGLRTPDIMSEGLTEVNCEGMGDAVVAAL